MAQLAEIIAALDELLEPQAFDDSCPNGLQVEGRAEVGKVATGVSASVELFERAAELGADLVLVHHGVFWDGDDPRLIGPLRARLGALMRAELSLAAYHLPLDGHPTYGNNALIASGVGAQTTVGLGFSAGRAVGWQAALPGTGISGAELAERLAALTGREPLAFLEGPQQVRTVGIVSGGGGRTVHDAVAAGLDAFVTGEPEEWSRALAREAGIHFIAGGHHATETFGVRALGELLTEQFAVEHVYVEIANPV